MSLFSQRRTRQAAQRDAELGINSVDEHIITLLGPRPIIDPNNLRQAGRIADARSSLLRRDLDDDLKAREDAYADHTSPFVILPLLIVITAIEIWGGTRVMRGIGVVGKDQTLFGIALGIGLQALTLFVARRARSSAQGTSSWARRLGTAVLFTVYGAVVVALAYSRAQEAGDQVSQAGLFAELAILLTATAFPAWLSEVLFEAFTKGRRLRRDIRRMRRSIRRDDRRLARGTKFTNRFGAEAEAYDRAAAEIRAVYLTEHRRIAASLRTTTSTLTVLAERHDS